MSVWLCTIVIIRVDGNWQWWNFNTFAVGRGSLQNSLPLRRLLSCFSLSPDSVRRACPITMTAKGWQPRACVHAGSCAARRLAASSRPVARPLRPCGSLPGLRVLALLCRLWRVLCGASSAWRRVRSAGRPSDRAARPMTMTAKGWQPRRLSRGAAGRAPVRRNAGQATGRTRQPFALPLAVRRFERRVR